MKVYVYEKKDKHKMIETIDNVTEITSNKEKFLIETVDNDINIYDKERFMISVYGY